MAAACFRFISLALCITAASAFTTSFSLSRSVSLSGRSASSSMVLQMGYVPDGLSKDQWDKIKNKERSSKSGLGRVGTNKFKSRSMDSFVKALEKGEAKHLLPVDPRDVRSGKIALKDVPYMQRGGSWDNSDIKGAQVKKWSKSDKKYATGGFRKEQSVSIFGGENLPWTGFGEKANKRQEAQGGRVGGANQRKSTRPAVTPSRTSSGKKDINFFGGVFGKK